ncbi:hypothetical protein BDFB_013616 [Asbolus verrucosus]|uniref:Uncharacterized protein n=1 Tax=Asbolus verrucosus TaxID=1661398 RepID=A0A482WCV9_ASBVE|nr:hypothetical protein BDFB_013616 [Asbolus verrucosus]
MELLTRKRVHQKSLRECEVLWMQLLQNRFESSGLLQDFTESFRTWFLYNMNSDILNVTFCTNETLFHLEHHFIH